MGRLPASVSTTHCLGDLVELQRGYDLTTGERRPGTVPVIGGGGSNGTHAKANVSGPGVVVVRSGSGFGNAWWVEEDFWAHNTVMFAKSFKGNDKKFAFYVLDWLDFSSYNSGGAQPSLNRNFIYEIPILLPPLAEQRRIADILSTWDRAIETVEALIANARAQKKALTQSLLTGKSRLPGFSGEWRSVAIGDVAQEVSERGLAHADYPVLSCSKYDGMVKSLSYFKKKVYSDDTSNYKVMRRGTFGFPSNHVEEGSIGYQDICDVGIVSPIYCVFRATDKIEDGFLYKLLKTDRYRQIFAAATNASVDRRGSLRWKEFAKIKVPLPPLDEQQAISTLIDTAELKERGLNAQRTALRQEKSALMQQLLTGKRRVKMTEKEHA